MRCPLCGLSHEAVPTAAGVRSVLCADCQAIHQFVVAVPVPAKKRKASTGKRQQPKKSRTSKSKTRGSRK